MSQYRSLQVEPSTAKLFDWPVEYYDAGDAAFKLAMTWKGGRLIHKSPVKGQFLPSRPAFRTEFAEREAVSWRVQI